MLKRSGFAIFGIIGAMDREIDLFIEKLEDVQIYSKAHMDFFCGNFQGERLVAVKSGVGKVNAACCTQILIDKYKPKAIFCTGVAGALREDLDFNDTVISRDVVQYDVDASCFGHEPGEIPNLGIKAFKASNELIEIARSAHQQIFKNNRIVIGRILTGDQFISSPEKSHIIRTKFNGDCVEMEGGAIGQVCYLNDIPFLIIRSISDKADGTAVHDYKTFVDESAKKSFKLISSMIKMLDKKV